MIFFIDAFILFWASMSNKNNLSQLKHHTTMRSNLNKDSQTAAAILIKLILLMKTHKKNLQIHFFDD